MLPILSRLMGKAAKMANRKPLVDRGMLSSDRYLAEPLVLVVVPTRELALQVFNDTRRFSYRSSLRPCVVIGGSPMNLQQDDITRGCDILVATPGRLCDMLERKHLLSLDRCRYTVIDEADELLDEDWQGQTSMILTGRGE
jgi:ATP-dependent RNA helicase DDX3X